MGSIAITGKPSGGKTIYAVGEVLRLLEEDTRPIVTNLALKLDEMVNYFAKRGRFDIDVYRRVRLLTYEETGAFWRYRGGPNARYWGAARDVSDAHVWAGEIAKEGKEAFPEGIVLPAAPANKEYSAEWLNTVLEAVCPLGGVIYFIDEMHEHLNARNWQRHGLVCSDYIAIHAHMGDDFYWITQAPSLVDSAFKVRTQEFIYCANGAKELLFGKFNRAGQRQFRADSYLEIYTGTQTSQWHRDIALDLDVAACYKRSRFGGAGDTKEKKKGLHLYWMWVAAAVVVVLAMFLTVGLPQMAGKALFGGDKPKPKTMEVGKVEGKVVGSPALSQNSVGSVSSPAFVEVRREVYRGAGRDWVATAREVYRKGAQSSWGLVEEVADGYVLCRSVGRVVAVVADREGLEPPSGAASVRLRGEGFAQVGRGAFVSAEGQAFAEGGFYQGNPIVKVSRERALVAKGNEVFYVYFDWPKWQGYSVVSNTQNAGQEPGMMRGRDGSPSL